MTASKEKGEFMLKLRLKTLMNQRNISTNKMSDDLKISKTNFNRYKNNQSQRWDVDILEKILTYLDCSISDLVDNTGSFKGGKADCKLNEEDQLFIFADQLYILLESLDKLQYKMDRYACKEKDDYDELVGRLYDAIEEIRDVADSLTPDVED